MPRKFDASAAGNAVPNPDEATAVAMIYATVKPILEQLQMAPTIVPLTAAKAVSEVKHASPQDIIDICAEPEGQMAALIAQFTALGYLLATRQAYEIKHMQANWIENVATVAAQISRLAATIKTVTNTPPAAAKN